MGKLLVSHAENLKGKLQTYGFEFWCCLEICQVVTKPKIRDDMGKLLVSHAETLKGKLQTYGFEFWCCLI